MEKYTKNYLLNDLLCTGSELKVRTELIQCVSKDLASIPEICFKIEDMNIKYEQNKVIKKNLVFNEKAGLKLANDLDRLQVYNLVHGDLNRKNILFDGELYRIVDWEPSLLQIKNGVKMMMFTPPYISLNDLNSKKLTETTDKLAWFFFILRIRNVLDTKSIAYMFRMRMNNRGLILPFHERILHKESFVSLFHRANDIKNMDYLKSC